jgi:putative glutamine amidotransferase
MKKILITQRLQNNETYEECREALDVSWAKLFKEIDLLPIVLPYEYDYKKYFDEFEIDGVLLTGGNDLYSLNNNELSKKRDYFEKDLISYAIENSVPIFGVCRGMQIIAEYFGSSFVKVDGQVNVRHNLHVEKKSKYFTHLQKLKSVNSFHNYAVKNLSNELIVSVTSEDKIIKAIEHKTYKIFAQMWHSERETPFINEELNLIRDFFK